MEIASKVFALGNSNAIRLPHVVMEALNLKTDDPVIIEVVNGEEVVIKKRRAGGYPSVRELFDGYTGGGNAEEFPASGTVGRELI